MAERMVELIARTLRDEIYVPACEHVIANDAWDEACADCRDPEVRRVAERVAAALADAGHLPPLDGEVRDQWGWLSTDGTTVYPSPSEQDARRAASRSGARQLMRRHIGPWQPVQEEENR